MGKKRGKSHILFVGSDCFSASFSNLVHYWRAKKSQISTFLIVSLILVLFIALIVFIVNSQLSLRERESQSVVSQLSLFPPEKFITHCVQKEIVDITGIVLAQGGVYDLALAQNQSGRSLESFSFRAQPYLFWSRILGNQFISDEFVATQLNEQLPRALMRCVNLSLYEEQGYIVRPGLLLTNTTIGTDTVEVVVYYPLNLRKGDTVIDRSIYSVSVDLPLGELLATARELVNGHLQNRPLDTQSLMHRASNEWLSRPLTVIDKNTLYPHTLYSLLLSYKEIELNLRLAVEGSDKFSQRLSLPVGSNNPAIVEKSSCVSLKGACFDNVPYNLCVGDGGEFIQDEMCVMDRYSPSDDVMEKFAACTFSDGSKIISGSSWCAASTDGTPIVGVGSRHSRLLCVNGEILQEPCQDYRSEVCAQKKEGDLLVAQCQPNGAESCAMCADKACCESASLMSSCTYTAQQTCVPKVPSGIAFWQSEQNICHEQFTTAMVSNRGKIKNPSAQATLCAQFADCGATISVIGETTQSQFNADYYSKLTSFWQQQKIPYMENVAQIGVNFESVSFGSLKTSNNGLNEKGNSQSVSALLSAALADLEQLASYDTTEYLDPNVSLSLKAQELSCQPFISPRTPSCSFCSLFDRACSEYVCRSMGAACRAIQNVSSLSGITCVDASLIESIPVNIIRITDGQGAALSTASLDVVPAISGFKISRPLVAHELLIINLTTDKPARCKPTYLPLQSFSDVGSLDLSSGTFSTQHQLKIKFVNDLPVFDRMLANFAVPDYSQLVAALADFKTRLDQLRVKYGFIQKYSPTFYPYLDAVVKQYLSDKTRPVLLSLIEDISKKEFSIFFACTDEFGNELKQSPFVKFSLQSSCNAQPPTILAVVPDAAPYVQRSMTLYLNKLGSCKYDTESVSFDLMKYNMSCASSEYDLSSAMDGSYACVANTNVLARDEPQIFVACSDKISNGLPVKNISLHFDQTAPVRVFANLSNDSLANISLSNRATVQTGTGYRCALISSTFSQEPLVQNNLSLSCERDICTLVYKNQTTPITPGGSLASDVVTTDETNQSLLCVPRVPSSSCNSDTVHISAPQSISLLKLPSFIYDEARVYGGEFVVSVRSRGSPITCKLVTDTGVVYNLNKKSDLTFVMASSQLTDNTLVKITCADDFGTAVPFASLVKK